LFVKVTRNQSHLLKAMLNASNVFVLRRYLGNDSKN